MSSSADAQVNQQTQQGPARNGSSERPRSRSPAGGLHRSGSVVVHDHVRAADAMPNVSDAQPRPSTASGSVKESIRSKLDAITKIHATGMARAGRMLRPDERTRARHAPSPRRRPASSGADGGHDKKSEFLGGVLRRFMPGHSNRGRHSDPQVESNQPPPRRRAHFYSRSAQLASPSDSRSGGGTPTAGARRTSDTGRMRREWSSEATAPGQGGVANREPAGAGNGNSTPKEPRAGGSPTVITDLPGAAGGRQDGLSAGNSGANGGSDAAPAGGVTPFPDAAGAGDDRRERPSLPALFGGEKKMFPSSAPVGDGGATPSSGGGGSRASGAGGKTPPGVRRRSAATDAPASNGSSAQLSAATEFLTAALTKREAQIEEMQAEMVKLQEAVASREASAESLRLTIGGRLKRWRDSLHDMEVGWLQRMEECDRAWGREVARNLDKQAERAMKTAGKHFSAKADELERRIEEFKRQQEAPSFIRARLTTAMYLMSSGAFTVVGRVLQVTAPVWRLVAVFFAFFYGWYLVVCGWCGRPCGRGVAAPIVVEGDAAGDGGSDDDSRAHRRRRHRHGRHKHRHRHRRDGSSASSTGDLSGLLDSASVGGGADRPGAVELSVSDIQLSGASHGFDIPEFGLDDPVAHSGDDGSDRRRDTTHKRHKHKHKHKHGHESKHKRKHGGSKHKRKHGDGSKSSSGGHSDTDKHRRHRRGHSRPRDDSQVDARSHDGRRGEKTAHKRARSRSRHRRGKHRSRSRSRDRTRHRSRHKRRVDTSNASR